MGQVRDADVQGVKAFRNSRRNAGFAVVAGALGVSWIALAAAVAVLPLIGETDEPSMVLLSPLFAAGGYLALRWAHGAWSAQVTVTPDEVVIRGPWRTQSYPLRSVVGFTNGLQTLGSMHPTPGVLLERLDGSPVPIWTLASEGFVWSENRNVERWRTTVDALNAALADQRH